jgi:hypothetical protein
VDDNFGNLMDHKTNILGDTNDVEQNQDWDMSLKTI